jgi:FAD/FMN-containing dehydrogenase
MTARRRTRRQLLQTAGAVAAGAAAAQLGVPAIGTARAATGLPALGRRLRGRLVVPGDASYAAAAAVWNIRFEILPRAIAFCASGDDVAEVLRFARENGWPVRARSGRHSFEAYCNTTGIVCDVTALQHAIVDRKAGTVRMGSGNDNQTAYENLILRHDLSMPLGSCPTVGFGGFPQGGGMSGTARSAGLVVDTMVSANVVLPDGRQVTASRDERPDLFWALRGGGGGNFGVVTEYTFETGATPDLLNFGIGFTWEQGADALGLYQQIMPAAPRLLTSASFRATSSTPASGTGPNVLAVTVGGSWTGAQTELEDMLEPFAALAGRPIDYTSHTYQEATIPSDCVPVPGRPDRVTCTSALYPNDQRSDFVNAPMSAKGRQTLMDWIQRWPGGTGGHEGGVQLEAFGPASAVNAVEPTTTAFVHRDSLFHMVYLNFWGPDDPPSVARANVQWVDEFYAAMRPFVSGYAYQNYIDRRLETWRHAYYGQNYERLRAVKRAYDPEWLLRFPQGIEPAHRGRPAHFAG